MGGVSSVLKTERNNTCIANVNDQSARKYNFPLKLKIKAVCIRFSNLVILNTVSLQVRIAVCKCLFPNPSAVIFFKFNRSTDLNFNMNKRQGTLFNFGVKKSRMKVLSDATNNDSSTSSLQSDLQDVQKEGKTASTQKNKSAFTLKAHGQLFKIWFHTVR